MTHLLSFFGRATHKRHGRESGGRADSPDGHPYHHGFHALYGKPAL